MWYIRIEYFDKVDGEYDPPLIRTTRNMSTDNVHEELEEFRGVMDKLGYVFNQAYVEWRPEPSQSDSFFAGVAK